MASPYILPLKYVCKTHNIKSLRSAVIRGRRSRETENTFRTLNSAIASRPISVKIFGQQASGNHRKDTFLLCSVVHSALIHEL